ncbi:MAG TPA: protein kinase, partial [Thermoanaerobaculia bacterium]|nr:protein kinase [Thermoanaerobaculia bacterium]
ERVKIVDFGLAHAVDDVRSTQPGTVIGTPEYMSPEQARGEATSAASDQFSYGCILYEMLTGRRAFARPSAAETISAILRDEPEPIEESNPAVPPPVRWIVERCLAKSPSGRYVSTRDLVRELQAFREHSGRAVGALPVSPPRLRKRVLPKAAGVAALLAFGGAAALLLTRAIQPRHEPDFRRLSFRPGVVWRALFVPNSDNILYTASWQGVPAKTFLTIPESFGTDRSLESETQLPMAYSGDGSQVLVLLGRSRAAINARGTLAWWPALGGKPRPILQNAGWADWSESRRLLAVVRDTGAERVLDVRTANGRLERSVFHTTGGISYVRFSPDGQSIAFIHHPSRYDDAGEVRIAETGRTISRALTPRFQHCAGLDWNQRSGEIWFTASRSTVASGRLWKLSPGGRLRAVLSFPDFFTLQDVASSGARCLLVSNAGGVALFVRRSGGAPKDLTWLGSSLITDISPDGSSLLFEDSGAGEKSLGTWMRPVDGGEAVRLGTAAFGKFSPDGRSIIALTPQLSGSQQLILIPVGPGTTRQLTSSKASYSTPSFAGPNTILFVRSDAGRSEVWRMSTDGTGARSLGAEGCDMPSASPSGLSFLCRGGETKDALYLFPMDKGAGRKLYELPEGTPINYARWNGSGEQVFAVTRDLRFITIEASTGRVLASESFDLGESVGSDSFIAAAFSADASIQAFSFDRFSSGLYLADGL